MALRNKKRWVFGVLTLVLGVCLIGFLELILQVVDFGANYDFVIEGNRPDKSEKKSLNSQYIALHYFSHLPVKLQAVFRENPWFEDTEFSKNKNPDTYRIFFVGASTTRGFPYPRRATSYSGFADQILHDVLPGRKIEVINAGYDALSSFGVLDVVRHVMDQSPDLIIVYSGHNEFIGHFGVNSSVNYGQNRHLIQLILRLHESRLYLLNELFLLKLNSISKPLPSRNSGINLFDVMLNNNKMSWGEEDHRIAENNFQENLEEIARLGEKRNVPILFSTLVSNLKDFSPLLSEFSRSLYPKDRQSILSNLEMGYEAIEHKNFKNGIRYLKTSLVLDPYYAQTHFELGQAYEGQADFVHAREEYQLAREYDKIHLRSCLKLNKIIRKIGKAHHIPTVEMGTAFEKASPNGLMGNNLFLEHVHPNINGHLIMADAIVHVMASNNLISRQKNWRWQRLRRAQDYIHDSGFNRKALIQSRSTAGRLLMDFPFYKCREGYEILKSVNLADRETKQFNDCRNKFRELHPVASAGDVH